MGGASSRSSRHKLEVSPNLWAGVGLVRGGAGTALVGDPQTVAARHGANIWRLASIAFISLGEYPHLEEGLPLLAELVFFFFFRCCRVNHARKQGKKKFQREHWGLSARPSPIIARPSEKICGQVSSPGKSGALRLYGTQVRPVAGFGARRRSSLFCASLFGPAPGDF